MSIEQHSVCHMLRDWRQRRRYSQLALNAEISQRHLSFLESGARTLGMVFTTATEFQEGGAPQAGGRAAGARCRSSDLFAGSLTFDVETGRSNCLMVRHQRNSR